MLEDNRKKQIPTKDSQNQDSQDQRSKGGSMSSEDIQSDSDRPEDMDKLKSDE